MRHKKNDIVIFFVFLQVLVIFASGRISFGCISSNYITFQWLVINLEIKPKALALA